MLNTQDPDILAIMDIITKDIKITIGKRESLDNSELYQERLDSLNINIQFEGKNK